MKRFSKIAMYAIMITLISFGSCQKDETIIEKSPVGEVTKSSDEQVSVAEDMLYFETIEGYESTIEYLGQLGDENFEKWENKISFNSMRKMLSEETREKLGIEDDLLATLINADGFIRIGENIFQLDVPDGIVLSIKAIDYDSSKGTDLNVFNTKGIVRTFSVDDNILGIIEGTAEANPVKGGCSSQKKGYYRTYTNYGWVDRKVAYQKAGFYFSIIGKIKQDYAYPRNHIQLKTYNYDSNNFRKKNGYTGCIVINREWQGGTGTSYSWRPYNSGRGLAAYKWHVEFYYYDNENSWSPKLKIICSSC